jgi:LuxR family maltose regulon positive regulatory protein
VRLPATKFALPREQVEFVVRKRLLDLLTAAAERPLTLLSAPPGAGKTALLGSWVGAGLAPGPVAWVSLDAADGDRGRFWRTVLEAMRRAGLGDGINTVAPQSRPELLVAATAGMLDDRDEPAVLVLDDFHEVAEHVHADLDDLLHRPPPALRVIIATRADPPLRLGRLRLDDELTEIREPELAMTLEETTAMLIAAGVAMADGDVRRLWEHTEGWVGALRLAALSLRGHPDPGAFVDDFAGDDRAISDYLLSEVVSGMSPEVRCFLLRTSVVTELNGELANALTDRTDGHRKLAELARGGALLAPLDRRGEWYRYHSLFRELLLAELRSDLPGQLPELHRRAAVWLAANGDDARGLMHAVQAEAWDLAARVAGERWAELLMSGETGALRPLIERLPAEWTAEDPQVALAVASAALDRGDADEAARLLGQADAVRDRVPEDSVARFDVAFSALQLYVARLRGDLEGALETGRELAREGSLEPGVVDTDLRALALVNLGIAELWTGELEAAGHHLERASSAAAEAGHDWIALIAVSHLAALASTQNDYPRSARLAGSALDLAARHGWERSWPAGAAYLVKAASEFLWDRSEHAAQSVALAQEALATSEERPLRAGLALLRSSMLAAQGDPESALAVLEAGEEELGDYPLMRGGRDHFAINQALLRAQLGERDRALGLVGGDQPDGPPNLRAAVVLAQLQLAGGDGELARTTLADWADDLDSEASPYAVQGWVVDALARETAADRAGADASLERALELAEPNGLRTSMLGFGRSLQPLLARQLRHGTSHRALVGDLIAALDGHGERPHATLLVEPLSPRERAVLRYLPTMMSNQEIAAELFVSVNTVKTHLKAIYRKLDVADRREAVRRARQLELLAP